MIVFDGEIKKAIKGKGGEPIPGVEYCNGWSDFVGMGIAVIAAYDYRESKYRVFLEDNLDELQKLIDQRDFIVGFNNNNFDNKLLAAHNITVPSEKSFDLLSEIRAAAGTFKGLGLGAICEANFNIAKNGDGAQAPILWQDKKYGKVIDYCLNDVKMTVSILNRLVETGGIIDPRNTRDTINISLPDKMRDAGARIW